MTFGPLRLFGGGFVYVITDKQSYSEVLRDVFFARVVTLPFFAGFKARRCKMLQVQPEHIPYLGVYLIDEQMVPDGDANAGCIRFTHTLRIGFSVIIENNDPLAAELKARRSVLGDHERAVA